MAATVAVAWRWRDGGGEALRRRQSHVARLHPLSPESVGCQARRELVIYSPGVYSPSRPSSLHFGCGRLIPLSPDLLLSLFLLSFACDRYSESVRERGPAAAGGKLDVVHSGCSRRDPTLSRHPSSSANVVSVRTPCRAVRVVTVRILNITRNQDTCFERRE